MCSLSPAHDTRRAKKSAHPPTLVCFFLEILVVFVRCASVSCFVFSLSLFFWHFNLRAPPFHVFMDSLPSSSASMLLCLWRPLLSRVAVLDRVFLPRAVFTPYFTLLFRHCFCTAPPIAVPLLAPGWLSLWLASRWPSAFFQVCVTACGGACPVPVVGTTGRMASQPGSRLCFFSVFFTVVSCFHHFSLFALDFLPVSARGAFCDVACFYLLSFLAAVCPYLSLRSCRCRGALSTQYPCSCRVRFLSFPVFPRMFSSSECCLLVLCVVVCSSFPLLRPHALRWWRRLPCPRAPVDGCCVFVHCRCLSFCRLFLRLCFAFSLPCGCRNCASEDGARACVSACVCVLRVRASSLCRVSVHVRLACCNLSPLCMALCRVMAARVREHPPPSQCRATRKDHKTRQCNAVTWLTRLDAALPCRNLAVTQVADVVA